MGIGWKEILMILLVVLLVFGTKKLKTIGSDLGSAVKGFKKAMSDGETEQQAAQAATSSCPRPGKPARRTRTSATAPAATSRPRPKSGQG